MSNDILDFKCSLFQFSASIVIVQFFISLYYDNYAEVVLHLEVVAVILYLL